MKKGTLIKKKSLNKELVLKKNLNPVDRRILFQREKPTKSINISDLLLAINLAVKKCELSEYICLLRLWEIPSEAISDLLKEKVSAEMLNSAKEEILRAAKELDSLIISF